MQITHYLQRVLRAISVSHELHKLIWAKGRRHATAVDAMTTLLLLLLLSGLLMILLLLFGLLMWPFLTGGRGSRA